MSVTNLTPESLYGGKESKGYDSYNDIQKRKSNELIVALCGPIGSGIEKLKNEIVEKLSVAGYLIVSIKISDLIVDYKKRSTGEEIDKCKMTKFEQYKTLQDWGDELRRKIDENICASFAIANISSERMRKFPQLEKLDRLAKNTSKIAFIVDQIKHPKEVELFRTVYKNNFYLLGLLRSQSERESWLKDERIPDNEIQNLIERDRNSDIKHGQHVESALQLSDYFIRNLDNEALEKSADRIINLIHGIKYITPTTHETNMHYAYSASLKSSCLSRQVGAAIFNKGELLATGCNDVPEFGGGLYSCESSTRDQRCFNKGKCYNDHHKLLLKEEIKKILETERVTNPIGIAEKIMKNTKAKYLIEYSRAVHAEMDAIVSIALHGKKATKGATLYCTTYPCHSCARHIVAAGIEKVIYIEPYEKSLALELHEDSIAREEKSGNKENKVIFEMFEGVSPKRYSKFFSYNHSRKYNDGTGKVVTHRIDSVSQVDPSYLDSSSEYELKIVKDLNENGLLN